MSSLSFIRVIAAICHVEGNVPVEEYLCAYKPQKVRQHNLNKETRKRGFTCGVRRPDLHLITLKLLVLLWSERVTESDWIQTSACFRRWDLKDFSRMTLMCSLASRQVWKGLRLQDRWAADRRESFCQYVGYFHILKYNSETSWLRWSDGWLLFWNHNSFCAS